MERQLVLEIGYEGGSFKLFAEFDQGIAARFFYKSGGPNEFDFAGDEPEPVVEHGPVSWEELLARELKPDLLIRLCPTYIHPAVLPLVQEAILQRTRIGQRAQEAIVAWARVVDWKPSKKRE